MNSSILKPIFFVVLLTLENILTWFLGKTFGILEEIKVPLELRVVAIRIYENVIAKFKKIEGWSKEINCSIRVKQGCPLSPTLFGIYID